MLIKPHVKAPNTRVMKNKTRTLSAKYLLLYNSKILLKFAVTS